MYPAQALADGLYSADDLPDEITIIACGVPGTTGTVQSFLTKSGSSYSGSPYNTTIRLITDLDGISTWLTGIENELLTTDRDCLVTILQSQAGEVVCGPTSGNIQNADNFADTYTATITGDDSESVTVTRESLCVWRGIDANGSSVFLRYIVEADPGFPQPQFDYKWNLDFRGCSRFKASGFQNTPVGNYEICYQGESTCTIS